jgi:hypothetical protein
MSPAELITVILVIGSCAGVVLAGFIFLIKQIIKQASDKAVAEHKAEENAVVVEKLRKTGDIIASPITADDVIRRLRDSKF